MRFNLPYPSPKLSPNARGHWSKSADVKKNYRHECATECRDQGAKKMAGKVHAIITFHPPDKRRRDLDNMLSSFKSGIDGIVDVIGVDDSDWRITIEKAEPVIGGKVVVEIKPILENMRVVEIPIKGEIT